MEKLKQLYARYREPVSYIFFGVCTTLVSWVTYWLLAHPLGMDTTVATVLSNIAGILFAYVTNRRWVFQSKVTGFGPVMKEMGSFFLSRLSTLVLDSLIMEIFAKRLGLNDMIVKIASNVIIIILNYVLSKLLVFRKKEQKK